MEDVFSGSRHSRRSSGVDEDEEALKWAAIEKLPTYDRLRTSIMQTFVDHEIVGKRVEHRAVDVTKLDMNDRQKFIDMLFKVTEEDNEKFLRKFRNRIDKALPTLPNVARNIAESALGMCGIRLAKRTNLTILKDASGIIKPSRMTLLLGPPSSGKTTLLLALADKLDPSLRATAVEGVESSLITDYTLKVTSKKDQEQYWADRSKPYRYITVTEFANRFKRFHVGMRLENELSVPFDKRRSHKAALALQKYSVPKMELLKACWDKEWLLIKRNSFLYVFKTVQIIIVAIISATVFLRTELHTRNEQDGAVYVGALIFAMIINMFNGFSELSLMISRLPVFYKQRDLLFHPVWTFTLPTFLLRVPISILESIVWMVITYYTMGFAPEASRFFKNFFLVFLIQQMAAGLFRLIAGICRTMIIANTGGALTLLLVFLLGGFIVPKRDIPKWWEWGYWVSPMTYGFNAFTVNEIYAPRWMNKLATDGNTTLGIAVLRNFDVPNDRNWYWIGAAALLGFTVLFNILFTFALMYLNPLGKPQATISEETANELEAEDGGSKGEPRLRRPKSSKDSLSSADENNSREMAIRRMSSRTNPNGMSRNDSSVETANGVAPKRGMVLPFTPLAMSFDSVNYYVDMPPGVFI
ncbi:hypothetical protein COLO4_30499 [Corchorus olitorius]|uniref:ABC-2 type transporter n=1 Tax=Corchorus olitorius TaxID=93759 RepID=A0A1R3H8A5_9ROSI|nr:hypothetical protein COLO4_30499 [Corchorus olitorius]